MVDKSGLHGLTSGGNWLPLGAVAVSGQTYGALVFSGTITGSVDAWSQGQTIASSAVSVTTSATSLASASTTRRAISIFNTSAAATVYIGPSGVSTLTGFPIPPQSNATFYQSAPTAWFGISSVGTANVRVLTEST